MGKVRLVEGDDLLKLTWDCKIVAIRWDLVPWGLVLDIDATFSEDSGVPTYRAWLIFNGLRDMTLPIFDSRLIPGIWITSEIMVQMLPNGFFEYNLSALIPKHNHDGSLAENPHKDIKIQAKELNAFCSEDGMRPDSYKMLSWTERQSLASDGDFLAAIEQA